MRWCFITPGHIYSNIIRTTYKPIIYIANIIIHAPHLSEGTTIAIIWIDVDTFVLYLQNHTHSVVRATVYVTYSFPASLSIQDYTIRTCIN